MEKRFKQITTDYLEGKSDQTQDKVIEDFISKMNQGGISLEEVTSDKKRKAKIYNAILSKTKVRSKSSKRFYQFALVGVLMMASALFYFLSSSVDSTHIYETTSAERTIILSDQTKVTLSAHSKIVVDKDYNQSNRQVSLQGKAFFNVTPNKKLAFIVTTRDLQTKVLGTSFTVDEQTTTSLVDVQSGKVQVMATNSEEFVILQQNQKAYYHNSKLLKKDASNQIISSLNQAMNMKNASFEFWSLALQQEFDVVIVSSNNKLKHIKITGDYRNSSLSDILNSFCFIHNLTYQINGKTVTIK